MAVETVRLSGEALRGVAPHLVSARLLGAGGQSVKLGRLRPAARPQVLRFGSYLNAASAVHLPAVVDYAPKASASLQRMYLNDQYGDCVIAGKYHAEGLWSANDSGPSAVALGTDNEVYNAYQRICGPGDHGCYIVRVLDYFREKGLSFNGVNKRIDGYVSVDWTNKIQVQTALYLFGALTLGINLPNDWTQSAVWDVTRSRIVGGHDVTCVGYNGQGVQISSWGRIYTITWAAFSSTTWLEECYAMLAPDWYGSDKLAPSGVDANTLKADLDKLHDGDTPVIDPTVPPPDVDPPPAGAPNYAGSVQGTVNGPLGSHPFSATVTLQPTAALSAAGVPVDLAVAQLTEQLRGSPNWLAVIGDLVDVISAVKSRDIPGVIAALQRLATDLGIPVPHLSREQFSRLAEGHFASTTSDPAPAPAPPSSYAGTIQGSVSGPLGSHPLNGTMSIHPVGAQFGEPNLEQLSNLLGSTPNWFAVFADLISLIAAVRTRNIPAIVAAIEKLASDLGLPLPPLPHGHQ